MAVQFYGHYTCKVSINFDDFAFISNSITLSYTIFLLVRVSHNNTVKQLGSTFSSLRIFNEGTSVLLQQWLNFVQNSQILNISHYGVPIYFQLLGWMGSRKMQLYYRNFLPFNCQCSYAWRTLNKSKENKIHLKAELTPLIWFYEWKDSGHYGSFSLLKKRPSLLISIKMFHVLKFATSWLHYELGI